MKYNHIIISEISFLTRTRPFNFFDETLKEKLQQKMEVKDCKKFFKINRNASKLFKESYGKLRYEELFNKMGLFYYFNFPEEMVCKMRKIGRSIVENNDIDAKKMADDIYGLFFKKVQDNLITLSTAIWMLKDSCVQENRTYLLASNGYENNASINMGYSLSNGKHGNIDLNNVELKK